MKQNNLFITGTPYQFIAAYIICMEKFVGANFDNQIYFLKSDRTDYEISNDVTDFNGKIIRFEPEEWVGLIKELASKEFFRFFFFQENAILNKYLAYHLKKKGALICLAPDGTKPYGEFSKKHEFFSMLKDTLSDYKILSKHQLHLPKLLWSRYYRYGATCLLDEVWLQYPDLFNAVKNKIKGKIVKMPEFQSNHLQKLVALFGFKNTLLPETDKVILYFNQPFYSKELIVKEFEILDSISNTYPDKKIYIKLHPSTKLEVKEEMMKLPFVCLIADKLPAEFYVGLVSNSLLLTGWSTALMHDLDTQHNKSYYLYPMYSNVGDKTMSQISLIGFPHIVMAATVKQLQFPNE